MTAPSNKAELFALLEMSKLLDPRELRRLIAESKGVPDDPATVCQWLMNKELITRYQAIRLLEGESDGFLLEGEEDFCWFSTKFCLLKPFSPEKECDCFLARQVIEQRLVTLKLVGRGVSRKPPLTDDEVRNIGHSLARLGPHPNLQQTYDFLGNDHDEWLIFEYFDGVDVDELCFRHGEIPWELAANYICQIADALEFGNRNGAWDWQIHGGRVLVNDEGRAMLVATGHPFVRSRQLDWKPTKYVDCMPPEIVQEKWSWVDIRSDIYSLGCVFFQMLSGKPPFHSDTIAEAKRRHMEESAPSILLARPDVPDDVASILQWMMAKHPADRIPTPADVWHSLQPFARPTIERMHVPESPRNMEPPSISLWKLLRMAVWGTA